MLENDPVFVRNKKQRAGTWKAVGLTHGGRAISVPVLYDTNSAALRPITGWDATKGERDRYL